MKVLQKRIDYSESYYFSKEQLETEFGIPSLSLKTFERAMEQKLVNWFPAKHNSVPQKFISKKMR